MSTPAAVALWLVTQAAIVGVAVYVTRRNSNARRVLASERVAFELEREGAKLNQAAVERALAAVAEDCATERERADRLELELGTRKVRLTGKASWLPTASPGVYLAADAGVLVGAVVHELRELAFIDANPPVGDAGEPFASATVDDGWRAYCRLEGSGAGSIQWSQDLHSLKRAQAEVERMLAELARAAVARIEHAGRMKQ